MRTFLHVYRVCCNVVRMRYNLILFSAAAEIQQRQPASSLKQVTTRKKVLWSFMSSPVILLQLCAAQEFDRGGNKSKPFFSWRNVWIRKVVCQRVTEAVPTQGTLVQTPTMPDMVPSPWREDLFVCLGNVQLVRLERELVRLERDPFDVSSEHSLASNLSLLLQFPDGLIFLTISVFGSVG